MMRKKNLYSTLILSFVMLFSIGLSSCSKNEDTSNGLRKVRYEAVGNATGTITFQFTPTMENPGYQDFEYDEYSEIAPLPWKKEVLHHPTQEGGFSASIEDAVPGQKITISIYVHNELWGSHDGIVGPDGNVHLFMNYFKDGEVERGGPVYD